MSSRAQASGSEPPGGDHPDHIPQWKIAVAAAAVAVVAATVAVIALVRGVFPMGDAERATPASVPSALSPAPAAPGTGERQRADDPTVSVVRSALDAWEAFARTADLDGVGKAFVVDGPQYRQFRREVRNGRAGAERVPDFSLRSVDAVEQVGRRREVVARVALSDEEGPPDVREWVFVLEWVGGSWRVWTVIDRTGG